MKTNINIILPIIQNIVPNVKVYNNPVSEIDIRKNKIYTMSDNKRIHNMPKNKSEVVVSYSDRGSEYFTISKKDYNNLCSEIRGSANIYFTDYVHCGIKII